LDFLSRFLGHFTYRQRFILAFVSFILCSPYPSIVVTRTFQFLIRQYQSQITGDIIQKDLNGLFSALVLHQERSVTHLIRKEPVEQSQALKKEIEEYFKLLLPFQQKDDNFIQKLAKGFSRLKDPSLQIESIYQTWKNLLIKEKNWTVDENLVEYQKILEPLKNELFKIGYNYALFQGDSLSEENYSLLVLDKLSRIEEMTKQIAIKSKLILDQKKESDLLNYQVLMLYDMVKQELGRVESCFEAFYQGMKDGEQYSISELKTVRKAYKNFSLATKEFLDQISTSQDILAEGVDFFGNIVLAKNSFINELSLLQHPIYVRELNLSNTVYYLFLAQLLFIILMSAFLIKFHGISSHLTALRDHIFNLSKGNLSHCFTSNADDAFGNVGKALDKIVDVIAIIISDLVLFSNQIQEITVRVAWAIREQEQTLLEQEKIIVDGKKKSQEIAERASFLSNLLNEICESSQLSAQSENAHAEIKKMRENMNFLVKASSQFLVNFNSFANGVQNTQKKVNFMDRLGDQAKMLSLNGKIENANMANSAANFSEITSKIGRFSDKSEEATSQIKCIIKEALMSVKSVKSEAQRCLSEINAGVEQLSLVSSQLEEIAKLGEDQQLKFLKVDEMMKIQAVSSQKIIQTVQNLLKPANENAELVHQLPNILENIVEQEKKMKEVIGKMVYTP
jgi:methyl-accepting chemotaxis protein